MRKIFTSLLATLLIFCTMLWGCTGITSESEEEIGNHTILEENDQAKGIISTLEELQISWFNMRGFYPEWLKRFLSRDLITLEIEEEISEFYALYVLKESYLKDYTDKPSGCAGEGFFDGCNFFTSRKNGTEQESVWVKSPSISALSVDIIHEGKEYKLDLCLAKKDIKKVIDLQTGETLISKSSAYCRYPLKLSNGELVEPHASECYDTYGADQEVYSLKGKFVTAKPDTVESHCFMGDLIDDEFFFELKEKNGKELLYRYAYSLLDKSTAEELFMGRGIFPQDDLELLQNLFVEHEEGLLLDFSIIKNYKNIV